MATLVITVLGDDRPGLVNALADAIAEHGGSWGRSQLAELAGKFAGIVTVEVPSRAVEDLTTALGELTGVLETTVQRADEDAAPATPASDAEEVGRTLHLDLVGHDQPGIVQQITATLSDVGVSVDTLETRVVPAPQAGGDLFEARARLVLPDGDTDRLRSALEDLARELQVDLSFDQQDQAEVWE